MRCQFLHATNNTTNAIGKYSSVKKNNFRAEVLSPSRENLNANAAMINANNGPMIVHNKFAKPIQAGSNENPAKPIEKITDNTPLRRPVKSPFDHI